MGEKGKGAKRIIIMEENNKDRLRVWAEGAEGRETHISITINGFNNSPRNCSPTHCHLIYIYIFIFHIFYIFFEVCIFPHTHTHTSLFFS